MLKRDTPGQLLEKPHIFREGGRWVMRYARHKDRKEPIHWQEREFSSWAFSLLQSRGVR